MEPSAITVQVTQDDILNGKRSRCDQCPIARALTRAGFTEVSVGATIAVVARPGIGTSESVYDLPEFANLFITNFDNGRPVEPFTFTMKRIA